MRNVLIAGIAALGLSSFGCAHTLHEEHMAARHEYRAQRDMERGDYDRAAHEERKADEAHERARETIPVPPAPPVIP